MSKKFRVGILGPTGTVGQRFIELLEGHPQFEVTALAAWTDEAAAARRETRNIFRTRRDELLSLIARELKLPAVAPEGAFYLMLDVSAHGSSMEVAERLLAHGVITVPGSAFGTEGEGYLRLSFCADGTTLAVAIRGIKEALEQKLETKG